MPGASGSPLNLADTGVLRETAVLSTVPHQSRSSMSSSSMSGWGSDSFQRGDNPNVGSAWALVFHFVASFLSVASSIWCDFA